MQTLNMTNGHGNEMIQNHRTLAGWWYTYPSEKYESTGMMTFPTEWGKKHVPKHQPVGETILISSPEISVSVSKESKLRISDGRLSVPRIVGFREDQNVRTPTEGVLDVAKHNIRSW